MARTSHCARPGRGSILGDRNQGTTVFLDVPVSSKATAVLEFDGTRFVQIN